MSAITRLKNELSAVDGPAVAAGAPAPVVTLFAALDESPPPPPHPVSPMISAMDNDATK
ncbi:hypothetical protein [Noviherbaspirillum saxi]|uniref:hypothetical protein n=1 Tax=Noviherbaspirillum saxi TaxID=2320863 RepID=UPI0013141C2A|nr:hypothetical protein [Noviherbaspirillum saxi]